MDDIDALPLYHYREDALLIWDAIANFVTSVLELYYKNDEVKSYKSSLQ